MSQEKPHSSASPGPWRWTEAGELHDANSKGVPFDWLQPLIALMPDMLALLRGLEYVRLATDRDGGLGRPFCPRCMHVVSEYEPRGRHGGGCPLGALLDRLGRSPRSDEKDNGK